MAIPALAWWWSIAATRHRWVDRAAGQSMRNRSMVSGVAGRCGLPVAAHQSVNNAQSCRYVCTVRGERR